MTLLTWLFIAFMLCLPALCMPPIFGCQTFVSDDYSSNTIANYTQVSGSWSVSAGTLTTSSTGGAVIIHNTSGSGGHGRVTATMQASVDGSKIGLIGSYTDSNNYTYAEIEINGVSNQLKLYSRSGGADTLLSNATLSVAKNTNMTMELCWDGTHSMASVTYGANVSDLVFGAYTGTSNKAGMRCTDSSGSATFDDFTYKQHINDESTCAACGKAHCTTICRTSPAHIQFVVTGVTNGTCTDCTGINKTVIGSQGASCVWTLGAVLSTICNGIADSPEFYSMTLQLINNTTTVKAEVQLAAYYPNVTDLVFYDLNDAGLGAPPADCTAINVSVPYDHVTGTPGTACHFTASSVTVSAA